MVKFLLILLISYTVFLCYMFLRTVIAYRYSKYWLDVIYEYQLYCVLKGEKPLVNFNDIRNLRDYVYDYYTFSRDKMINDNIKVKILKDHIGQMD